MYNFKNIKEGLLSGVVGLNDELEGAYIDFICKNNSSNILVVTSTVYEANKLYNTISNYTNKRYDTPLYRAFNKYGLDKFTYQLLDVLEENDYREARKQLDLLEIKYIEIYNSYNNGYNQTQGGDGGILGYKFTEEQIKKQRERLFYYRF